MATLDPQSTTPQPMPIAPVTTAPVATAPVTTVPVPTERVEGQRPGLRIYGHSNLFYWWPVWVVGYLMALLTWIHGKKLGEGFFGQPEIYNANNSLGVIFFLTVVMVILITNVTVRGWASGTVIVSLILVAVLLAYFHLWDTVLNWFWNLSVHLNLGAYMFFSTVMFAIWVLTVFGIDHLTYWEIMPGQVIHVQVLGAGSQSYDTGNMTLEKHRNDIFRHWILGMGSGDIEIHTSGPNNQRLYIPNVLFIGSKIGTFQEMIATRPDAFPNAVIR